MQTNLNAPIETLLEAIGENLKTRMKQGHLDQKTLAKLADLNRNTVSAALSGHDIMLSTLVRLTRELGYLDWLLPLLESPQPSPLESLSKTRIKNGPKGLRNSPPSRKLGRSREKLS